MIRQQIRTTATVQLDPAELAIVRVELETEVEAMGLAEDRFRTIATEAKRRCPVSKALGAVPVVLLGVRLLPATAARG